MPPPMTSADALQAIELHRDDAVGQLRTYGPSLRVDEVPAYGGDRALRPDFLDHVWCDIGVEHRTEAVARSHRPLPGPRGAPPSASAVAICGSWRMAAAIWAEERIIGTWSVVTVPPRRSASMRQMSGESVIGLLGGEGAHHLRHIGFRPVLDGDFADRGGDGPSVGDGDERVGRRLFR